MKANVNDTMLALGKLIEDDKRYGVNSYDQDGRRMTIVRAKRSDSGIHPVVNIAFDDDRKAYDVINDYDHLVYASWTGDEDIDAGALMKDVEDLMEEYN